MDIAAAVHMGNTSAHGEMARDGFTYSLRLVALGWQIYSRSNYTIIPDPRRLAEIDPNWLADLATLDQFIASQDTKQKL